MQQTAEGDDTPFDFHEGFPEEGGLQEQERGYDVDEPDEHPPDATQEQETSEGVA